MSCIFRSPTGAADPLSNRDIGFALGLSDQYVATVCRDLSARGRVHKTVHVFARAHG